MKKSVFKRTQTRFHGVFIQIINSQQRKVQKESLDSGSSSSVLVYMQQLVLSTL